MRPRRYNRRRVRRQQPPKSRNFSSNGIDFVRCLICGKHLRVISGRHLSTHGTDRETYIEEYRLRPDQLCSKTFRINHSSRSDSVRLTSRSGLTRSISSTRGTDRFTLDTCRTTFHIFIIREFGFSMIGTKLCGRRDLPQSRCGCGVFGIRRSLSAKYSG
jgi:hypothetical protein